MEQGSPSNHCLRHPPIPDFDVTSWRWFYFRSPLTALALKAKSRPGGRLSEASDKSGGSLIAGARNHLYRTRFLWARSRK
jgi:hypothetical protein